MEPLENLLPSPEGVLPLYGSGLLYPLLGAAFADIFPLVRNFRPEISLSVACSPLRRTFPAYGFLFLRILAPPDAVLGIVTDAPCTFSADLPVVFVTTSPLLDLTLRSPDRLEVLVLMLDGLYVFLRAEEPETLRILLFFPVISPFRAFSPFGGVLKVGGGVVPALSGLFLVSFLPA